MTGNLFLAKYLASNVKICESHSLIIVVDHKTCSVRMNFNLKFMPNKFTCATLFWVESPTHKLHLSLNFRRGIT